MYKFWSSSSCSLLHSAGILPVILQYHQEKKQCRYGKYTLVVAAVHMEFNSKY
jgi:hypothetical protein